MSIIFLDSSMFTSLELFNTILGSKYLLLAVIMISACFKLFLLLGSARYIFKTTIHRRLLIFSMLFLAAAFLDDVFYMLSLLLRQIFELKGDIPNFTLFFRLDWAFFITQYQALALFLLVLAQNRFLSCYTWVNQSTDYWELSLSRHF